MSWICGETKIRELWGLDPTIAFLNHGSYGAVPTQVLKVKERISAEIESNPPDFLARRLPMRLQEQKGCLSSFLNVESDGLVFVPNATNGVGAVLRSMPFSAGDEIVFHDHGYGWVRQGLQNLSLQKGVLVKEAVIRWPAVTDSEIVESFLKQINSRTRLVVCDHVSSPTAIIFPVSKIIEAARSMGVPVLVDGAHAPGFVPLDLKYLDPDFYIGNLHKWICAPRGSAFLFVKDKFRRWVRPESLSYSGGITHNRYDYDFSGYFDWTGTFDFSSWLSVSSALQFNEGLGWQRIFEQRKKLLLEAKSLFEHDLQIASSEFVGDHFLSAMLTVPWPLQSTVEPTPSLAREISSELLKKNKVEVPVFCFGNRLYFRVSAQAYNRIDDYQRLSDAVVSHRLSAVRNGVG